MQSYHKLVRDKIPEIIRSRGANPTVHKANDEEYLIALYQKVLEELDEFKSKPSTEEMADMMEVLHALADHLNIPWETVEPTRQQKREERGGFEEKIILESTD